MINLPDRNMIKEGDLVQLVGLRHAFHLVRAKSGEVLQTHRGVIPHSEIIGKPWGSQIASHLGNPFFLLEPSIADLVRTTKRNTQIMYPKDIGYILITMGIGPGSRVLEAGCGSGGFTRALAYYVADNGHVYSYEKREEMLKLAQSNINELGLGSRVSFSLRDIEQGFFETGLDAIFLDLPNPYDYLDQVRVALKSGGFFGTILPTVNQVSRLLVELRRYSFAFTDVAEILLRFYKSEADRLRPTDRMVAHTGYLVFSRKIHQDYEEMKAFEEAKE